MINPVVMPYVEGGHRMRRIGEEPIENMIYTSLV